MRWRTGNGIQVVALNGPTRNTWPEHPAVPATFKAFETAVPVTVHLPQPMYVYEMRTGRRSEGPTNKFETGVRAYWPSLLVISERKLNAPVLTAPGNVAKRGRLFQLTATIPDAQGMHSLKLRALTPDGKNAPWFPQSVVVEDGTAKIDLPIAYNEQPGKWTLTATDLYTGKSAVSSFVVE